MVRMPLSVTTRDPQDPSSRKVEAMARMLCLVCAVGGNLKMENLSSGELANVESTTLDNACIAEITD